MSFFFPASASMSTRAAPAVFTASIFLSAALLFAVQPMFAKMALPMLGGAPAVWSVALVFFQGMLLLGYLWAHLLVTRLSTRTGALLHLGVCLFAFAMLPIAAVGWQPPAQGGFGLWLLAFFAVSTGVPFFAVAANGPLLQAWFARTGHSRAVDPYFLYAASNAGSLVALLAYPFALEPLIGLSVQSRVWTGGFVALSLCLVVCAAMAHGGAAAAGEPPVRGSATSWTQRFTWMAPSFVASGLLVSSTAHIATDIASAPLLWVLPLALFLATFVVAFRTLSPRLEGGANVAHVFFVALALLLLVNAHALSLAVHMIALTLAAFVAHRALYAHRPERGSLTSYYTFMSLGGVAGGVFAALIAPVAFNTVFEYPLLLAASLLCRTGAWTQLRAASARDVAPAVLVAALVFIAAGIAGSLQGWKAPLVAATGALVCFMLLTWRRAPQFIVFAASAIVAGALGPALVSEAQVFRSFFGVHRIGQSEDGRVRYLAHGTTIHGGIRVGNADGSPLPERPQPTTYYTFSGPIGEAIRSVRARKGVLSHLALVGLGTGALACHRQPGETFAFYEIDPLVIDLARDRSKFRFMADCAPDAPIILGDARLRIAEQREVSDLLIVDAFSSDAIPVHLMTAEAIALYRSKLGSDGVILFHISHRMLDLSGVVARAAAEAGLQAYLRIDTGSAAGREDLWTPSRVIALVARPGDLGDLALASGNWNLLSPDPRARPWTDDYSTILEPLRAGLQKR
jgi:hypothetical protein